MNPPKERYIVLKSGTLNPLPTDVLNENLPTSYLADIFGTKFVGGIHGRLLTAWASAGVFGPLAITSLREISVKNAINDFVKKEASNIKTYNEQCATMLPFKEEVTKEMYERNKNYK